MSPDLRDIRFIDTLRISDRDWRTLTDQLDRQAARKTYGRQNEHRRHERLPYRRVIRVGLITEQPGGGWVGFQARSRNLSESGVGLFHGQFIHVGSRCEVILKDHKGLVRVPGLVRRCKLLSGKIHDLGIEFDELIPIGDFILSDIQNKAA